MCLAYKLSLASCPDDEVEPLVSGPRYSINYQQLLTSEPPDLEYTPEGLEWCFTNSTPQTPWVQINFGTEVNIAAIQTDGPLISFQVEIGSSSSSLIPLMSPNSSDPMV